MTKREACWQWVRGFNAYPESMIRKIMANSGYCDIYELTPPSIGDRVYMLQEDKYGTIEAHNDSMYEIGTDDGDTIRKKANEFDIERDGDLPIWGTMWSFDDSADNYWLDGLGGLQIMADHGFRIYESEDVGYIFGIDGAGYDFYEAHWIPLYEARGLQWHEETA